MKIVRLATILTATAILYANPLQASVEAREVACPAAETMIKYFAKKHSKKRWEQTSGEKDFWSHDTDNIHFDSAILATKKDKKWKEDIRELTCSYVNTKTYKNSNVARKKEYSDTCKFQNASRGTKIQNSRCEASRDECKLTDCS